MATTVVTPTPIMLNNVAFTLTIGSTTYDFSAGISSAQFTPSTSTVPWKGMKPGVQFTFATSPTWTLALALADDLATTNSLTNTLLANQGQIGTAVFRPVAGGPGWQATVNIVPAGLGGAVDTVSGSTVTLGVQGAPVVVAAASGS